MSRKWLRYVKNFNLEDLVLFLLAFHKPSLFKAVKCCLSFSNMVGQSPRLGVSLHLGKTENADETKSNHAGIRLQPPIGTDRVSELGAWENRDINASGTSWDVNSVDITVAGLGWFSLGLKGEANLSFWTYDGIQITLREPMVLDRVPFLERPGFWLPKAISDAIANQSKVEAKSRKIEEDTAELHSDIPS